MYAVQPTDGGGGDGTPVYIPPAGGGSNTMDDTSTNAIGLVATSAIGQPELAPFMGSVLKSILTLGGLIKGKTGHMNSAVLDAPAHQFADTLYNYLEQIYGVGWDTKDGTLLANVQRNFSKEMNVWWGFGPSYNGAIQRIMVTYTPTPKVMSVMFYWWYMWVFTNVDQAAGPGENGKIAANTFAVIFLTAFTQSGISTMPLSDAYSKVKDVSGKGTTPGGGTTQPAPVPAAQAGLVSLSTLKSNPVAAVLLLVVVGGIIYGVASSPHR